MSKEECNCDQALELKSRLNLLEDWIGRIYYANIAMNNKAIAKVVEEISNNERTSL